MNQVRIKIVRAEYAAKKHVLSAYFKAVLEFRGQHVHIVLPSAGDQHVRPTDSRDYLAKDRPPAGRAAGQAHTLYNPHRRGAGASG